MRAEDGGNRALGRRTAAGNALLRFRSTGLGSIWKIIDTGWLRIFQSVLNGIELILFHGQWNQSVKVSSVTRL